MSVEELVNMHQPMDPAGGLATGLTGGVLSGLSGVGGGFVLLPMLRLLLGVHQRQAQGVTGCPAPAHQLAGPPPLPQARGPGALGPRAGDHPRLPARRLGGGRGRRLASRGAVAGGLRGLPAPAGHLDRLCFQAPGRTQPAPSGPGPGTPREGLRRGVPGRVLLGPPGGWGRGRHDAAPPALAAAAPVGGATALPHRDDPAHPLAGAAGLPPRRQRFSRHIFLGLASGFALGTHFGARLAMKVSIPRLRAGLVGLMLATAGVMVWKS